MAANTNVVVVTGRLTRDPEVKQFNPDKSVASFSLAVNGFGDKVSFFDVEAWGRTAQVIEAYAGKGKLLTVNGRLDQQRWEKDGQKRSKVIVIASSVELGPKTSAAADITVDDGFDHPKTASEDIPF